MGINPTHSLEMYQSTYLSVRVHTEDEALSIEPEGNADILLWLIDVYDIGESEKCAEAVQKLILKKFHKLYERVPGILPQWTKGMMAWVTYLNALKPCYEYDAEWVVKNHFMVQEDPENWSVVDMLTALDALALRWNTVCNLDRKPLQAYLRCIWSCAKKWTMHLHPTVEHGLKEGELMKLHPKQIMACFSRFFWFNRTLELYDLYERNPCEEQCENFFVSELRHFILRKFRDELLTDTWETLPLWGDQEIAGHDQLGDSMSSYSALYKRQPVCLLQMVQKCVLYDDPKDVRKQFPNSTDMKIIQTYFQNNYKVDFVKFFVCFERNHAKHEKAVRSSAVPIIVESFGKFSVVHQNRAYCHGTVAEVFPVWAKLAKKPHGLDISDLKKRLFSQPNSRRRLGTIYELTVS
jgi:hypothetical protein